MPPFGRGPRGLARRLLEEHAVPRPGRSAAEGKGDRAMIDDKPLWKAYRVQQVDAFGYATERWGVREEYRDGATRHIHHQVFETEEDAQILAIKFNSYARQGRTYDNAMKAWG